MLHLVLDSRVTKMNSVGRKQFVVPIRSVLQIAWDTYATRIENVRQVKRVVVVGVENVPRIVLEKFVPLMAIAHQANPVVVWLESVLLTV